MKILISIGAAAALAAVPAIAQSTGDAPAVIQPAPRTITLPVNTLV